jgi:S1-C subfamily serine protease
MSESLIQWSEAMASLVEKAGPSLVRVEGRRRLPSSGILYSADGLIITANHALQTDENVTVGLHDGSTATATIVGRDPSTDLALLRVDQSGLPAATWVDASELKVGHLVLALARPGRTVQATLGIVSALGGPWRTGGGGEIDRYLQTDVVMYPGFSGGALLNAAGHVAGLNSSALGRGVSLAIPAATVKRVVETLLKHGKLPRGYLGVGVQPVRLSESLQANVGQETGLMLLSIEEGGPAQQGGLIQGDVVVTFADQPIRTLDELQALLSGDRVGQSVPVRIVRSGQVQTLTVTIGQG